MSLKYASDMHALCCVVLCAQQMHYYILSEPAVYSETKRDIRMPFILPKYNRNQQKKTQHKLNYLFVIYIKSILMYYNILF